MSLGAPLQAASLSSRGAVRGANFARLTSGARATSASMSTRRTTVMRTTRECLSHRPRSQLPELPEHKSLLRGSTAVLAG